MFSRSTGWRICLIVTVVTARAYSEPFGVATGASRGNYSAPNLEAECEEHLGSAQLSVETAVSTALRAIKISCNNTRQAAVEFIKDHLAQVLISQGWVHTVLNQPEEVVQLSQLLSEELVATRTPAVTQPSQPDNDNSEYNETLTSTASPPMPTCPTSPVDRSEVSFFQSLFQQDKDSRLIDEVPKGNTALVRNLLAAGAFPGKRDAQGMTALQWAAWYGYVEVASCLLEAGSDVDTIDVEGYRPLHRAVMRPSSLNNVLMVRLLASAGADIDPQDVRGFTPLHLAVRHNRPDVVQALLEVGADRGVKDKRGSSPLDMTWKSNNKALIDILSNLFF